MRNTDTDVNSLKIHDIVPLQSDRELIGEHLFRFELAKEKIESESTS